jgi:exodeoxyribonuclease VII large subunit
LEFLSGQYFLRQRQVLELADEKIASSDPRKVLKKGYALVEDDSGRVISKIKQVQLDQSISVHISDGTIEADVAGIKEKD